MRTQTDTRSSPPPGSLLQLASLLLVAASFIATGSVAGVSAHNINNNNHPPTIFFSSTATSVLSRRLAFVPQPSSRISYYALPKGSVLSIRGGSDDVEVSDDDVDSDDDDESDAEVKEAVVVEDDDQEMDFDEESVEEEEDTALVASIKAKKNKGRKASATVEFDQPFTMPITMTLYATFVPIVLSRKVDLFQPTIVRTLR